MKNKYDLRDQVFGKLVVVDRETDPDKIPAKYQKAKVWYCVCECGNFMRVPTGSLVWGKTTHCGCNRKKKEITDIPGTRYGKLVALERCENVGKKAAHLCKCDCGKYRMVANIKLRSGEITSCGCDNKTNCGPKSKYVFDINPKSTKPKRVSRILSSDLSYGMPDI